MTARFLASRGESNHLPARETWIQKEGRPARSWGERSCGSLPIGPGSVREARPKSILRRGMATHG